MQNNLLELLGSGVEELNISLNDKSISELIKYTERLTYWNTKVNLVSYKKISDLIILHILDSLTLLKILDHHSEAKIMDIGTGAGLPGMILKIAATTFNVTLVEKNPRKVLFLKEIIGVLGLTEIMVLNRDYNSLRYSRNDQKYDVVVSRAFSSKASFFRKLTHFINEAGSFIVMAGPSFEKSSLDVEGFCITNYWEGRLPHSNISRKLIKCSRTGFSRIE